MIASGTEGTCAWTIDDNGVLTIGSGVISHTSTHYFDWTWRPYLEQITAVDASASISWVTGGTAYGMFWEMEFCTSMDLSGLNTANVVNMHYMFGFCQKIISLDLSRFDTSSVTDMIGMFLGCKSIVSLDVSSFDTSNVTNMNGMFNRCEGLTHLDLSTFDTSNVVGMANMFYHCLGLQSLDLTGFDTSKVVSMGSMFAWDSALEYLELPVSNVLSADKYGDIFLYTTCPIYIVNERDANATSPTRAEVATFWRTVVADYANAHYEADDNTPPDITFSVTRVGSSGSRVFDGEGKYAYLSATVTLYETYLPSGWSNSLGAKSLTGYTSLSAWTDAAVGLVYSCVAWDFTNSNNKQTYTLSIADSITDTSGTVRASHSSSTLTVILAGVLAAFSVYHDPVSGLEGAAFGMYASQTEVLQVPWIIQADDNIHLGLDTTAQSGTDYEIYTALVSLGWDSDVIV